MTVVGVNDDKVPVNLLNGHDAIDLEVGVAVGRLLLIATITRSVSEISQKSTTSPFPVFLVKRKMVLLDSVSIIDGSLICVRKLHTYCLELET